MVEERTDEAQGVRLEDLEASHCAILQAVPDVMFVLHREGTYLDYHARDASLLFQPPLRFLGRNLRDVLPAPDGTARDDGADRGRDVAGRVKRHVDARSES